MNSAVKASISLRHARARSSRSSARCRSFSFSASAIARSHSGAEISPSKSASSSSSVASNRAGTNRSCRYLLPQFTRKAITSLLLLTAFMISPRSKLPEESTSIMSKIWRAMFRNASEKAASSAAAACSRRARASWSCSTRFFNPLWIATSLRGAKTGERSQRRRRRDTYFSDSENAPLVLVDLSIFTGIELLHGLVYSFRLQQEL